MVKVKINNCPNDAYGYIVCRLNGGELWYWGCYETKEEAMQVADEFKNGLVVTRNV